MEWHSANGRYHNFYTILLINMQVTFFASGSTSWIRWLPMHHMRMNPHTINEQLCSHILPQNCKRHFWWFSVFFWDIWIQKVGSFTKYLTWGVVYTFLEEPQLKNRTAKDARRLGGTLLCFLKKIPGRYSRECRVCLTQSVRYAYTHPELKQGIL